MKTLWYEAMTLKMSKIQADIFRLNYSDARIAGFWIQDFKLATGDREVIFLGDQIDNIT